eukprot:gene3954-5671_t
MSLEKVNNYIDELIWELIPTVSIELDMLKNETDWLHQALIAGFGALSFPIGALLNKAAISGEKLEITQILPRKQCENWCLVANETMYKEAQKIPIDNYGEISVTQVSMNILRNDLVAKINSHEYYISPNNISGLLLSAIVEEMDSIVIGKDRLFKKSLILIKTWCYNESKKLGNLDFSEIFSHEALTIITLWIFIKRSDTMAPVDSPLVCLFYFLEECSQFDWENCVISLDPNDNNMNFRSSPMLEQMTSIIQKYQTIHENLTVIPEDNNKGEFSEDGSNLSSSPTPTPGLLSRSNSSSIQTPNILSRENSQASSTLTRGLANRSTSEKTAVFFNRSTLMIRSNSDSDSLKLDHFQPSRATSITSLSLNPSEMLQSSRNNSINSTNMNHSNNNNALVPPRPAYTRSFGKSSFNENNGNFSTGNSVTTNNIPPLSSLLPANSPNNSQFPLPNHANMNLNNNQMSPPMFTNSINTNNNNINSMALNSHIGPSRNNNTTNPNLNQYNSPLLRSPSPAYDPMSSFGSGNSNYIMNQNNNIQQNPPRREPFIVYHPIIKSKNVCAFSFHAKKLNTNSPSPSDCISIFKLGYTQCDEFISKLSRELNNIATITSQGTAFTNENNTIQTQSNNKIKAIILEYFSISNMNIRTRMRNLNDLKVEKESPNTSMHSNTTVSSNSVGTGNSPNRKDGTSFFGQTIMDNNNNNINNNNNNNINNNNNNNINNNNFSLANINNNIDINSYFSSGIDFQQQQQPQQQVLLQHQLVNTAGFNLDAGIPPKFQRPVIPPMNRVVDFNLKMKSSLPIIIRTLQHIEIVLSPMLTSETLICLTLQVLNRMGPTSIGEIGKQMQTITGNAEFASIFGGLSLNTTVEIQRAVVWMDPFEKSRDDLSLLRNDYVHNIIADEATEGKYNIMSVNEKRLSKSDWNEIINMPTYRLNIEV